MTTATAHSAPEPGEPLTPGRPRALGDEANRTTLAECEAIIERGLGTFIEVGEALLRIRDERLYRETNGTFDDYCRQRWGFSPQHGGRLIAAAESIAALEPNGSTPPPASEAVARELVPLRDGPEVMREAWTEAVEEHGPTPTAAQVRGVVAQRKPPADPPDLPPAEEKCLVPADLEAALKREFAFSGRAEEHYGCVLVDPMSKGGVRWLNPPPRAVGRWVRAAHEHADSGRSVAVCVVPVDTTADWWWKYCRRAEIRFLRRRLVWVQDGREIKQPSAIVIFGRRAAVRWLDCDELLPAPPGPAQAGDDTPDVSDGRAAADSAEAVAGDSDGGHLHAVPESA